MKLQVLKTRKKMQKCHGKLLQPLVVGKAAIFSSGGKVYRTSRVIHLYEQTQDDIRFETINSYYHLTAGPSPVIGMAAFPRSLATCA